MAASGGAAAASAWELARGRLSEAARARAVALGDPTNALEDWRYVDLAPLKLTQALLGPSRDTPATLAALGREVALPHDALTIIDGRVATHAAASRVDGMAIESLESLSPADAGAQESRWRALVAQTTDVSACWALMHHRGGVRVRVAAAVREPLMIAVITRDAVAGTAIDIELAPGASASIAILHLGLGNGRAHLLTSVRLGDGARLSLTELQLRYRTAQCQLTACAGFDIERDAHLAWTTLRSGAVLGRSAATISLRAPGAEFQFASLADVGEGLQWHDLTRVDHLSGNTTSVQTVRAIAEGKSAASYDGLVKIARGADGADAKQRHQSLLLSAKARVDSRPQLDIAADDVKAAHGSSIGNLAEDELFYLRSRGLSHQLARGLLVGGFAREITSLVPVSWLPGARRSPTGRAAAEARPVTAPI